VVTRQLQVERDWTGKVRRSCSTNCATQPALDIVLVLLLLSTHADNQGVDTSFTVCFFTHAELCAHWPSERGVLFTKVRTPVSVRKFCVCKFLRYERNAIQKTFLRTKNRKFVRKYTHDRSCHTTDEKVQLSLVGSRQRAFHRAIDEPCALPLSPPKGGSK